MKNKLLSFLLIGSLIAVSGCSGSGNSIGESTESSPASAQETLALGIAAPVGSAAPASSQVEAVRADTAQDFTTFNQEQTLPLKWETYADVGTVRLLKSGLPDAAEIVREVPLTPIHGSQQTKVAIYRSKQDQENYLYAALIKDGAVYDLGPAAGYNYTKETDIEIGYTGVFQKEALKIVGFVGADAAIAQYVDVTDGVPRALLHLDSSHIAEQDVDHDGLPEIVTSAGVSPATTVYRWAGNHVESCDLNQSLRSEWSAIAAEGNVEAGYPDGQSPQIRLFWLRKDGLKTFASYTKEEYFSDRFVKIPYSPEELALIQKAADAARVYEPLLARKGIATDYGITAEHGADGSVTVSYPHFFIRESRADLRPEGLRNAPGNRVFLKTGAAGWLEKEANGGGAWYGQLGSTYVEIGSAKPFDADQLLYVLASLAPLEEVQQETLQRAGTISPEPAPAVSRDYLFALKAAQEYAAAWTRRDPESGLQWVTDAWKAGKDAQWLDAFFRGTSNPHHMAFELTGKRQIDKDTYLFRLWMYEYYIGQSDWVNGLPFDKGSGATLEVVRQGADEWGEPVWRVNP